MMPNVLTMPQVKSKLLNRRKFASNSLPPPPAPRACRAYIKKKQK